MSTKDTNPRRPDRDAGRGVSHRGKPRRDSDVVYTQPGPFNRNRFLLHLLSIVAVVLALTFGISLFFTVKDVEVSGTQKYTAKQIEEASGIKKGENLLSVNQARISSKIMEKLPYVSSVRVKISLPDKVQIMIEELDVRYSIASDDGQWWIVREDGRVVDKTNAAEAETYTKLEGVVLTQPEIGKQAVAAEPPSDETTPDGEPVPVTVTGAQRLQMLFSILKLLESNGVVEKVTGINVQDLNDLQLWYGDRFHVLLGNSDDLSYKISSMKAAIAKLGEFQSGMLDVSFTVDTGSGKKDVIFEPYS